ncbi:conjugative transposon protein TraM [uncultured Duncaniella sp.]|uniref:conjugative transposon protein TraM n=1 Tax=uncultured Duncaniella sp. TaxID=2768039 RepID=UPI00272A2E08|nr:conjugative transposon protein TraM [uncultured Duncaniella sp.]
MKWIDELKAKLKPKNAAEKEKLKKYLIVFPLMFLSCIACLWLIFSPSSDDDSSRGRANTELPDGSSEEMHERKIEAYEAEALEAEHNQRATDAASLESVTDTIALQPDSVPSEIESSAQAYQSVQASLEDFYIPEDQSAARVAELQARIDELEMQNAYALQQTQQPNEVELMEKSYQLAAQYLGTGNSGQQAVIVDDSDKKDRKVMPVNQVNRNVVSSLSAATSGRSFSTAVGGRRQNFKNTISACIASDQSVIDGQSVKLRTLEPMWIGNSLLPKNTTIVGSARLQGERLEISVENIEAMGCIMEVDLAVYDSDGQEGINIPNSMESDALKEIGANMGSTVGSSINISTNAGAQIVSDVGRGLLNGVGQYLTKKVRQVKVHLKSGYKVMLKQNEQ